MASHPQEGCKTLSLVQTIFYQHQPSSRSELVLVCRSERFDFSFDSKNKLCAKLLEKAFLLLEECMSSWLGHQSFYSQHDRSYSEQEPSQLDRFYSSRVFFIEQMKMEYLHLAWYFPMRIYYAGHSCYFAFHFPPLINHKEPHCSMTMTTFGQSFLNTEGLHQVLEEPTFQPF